MVAPAEAAPRVLEQEVAVLEPHVLVQEVAVAVAVVVAVLEPHVLMATPKLERLRVLHEVAR